MPVPSPDINTSLLFVLKTSTELSHMARRMETKSLVDKQRILVADRLAIMRIGLRTVLDQDPTFVVVGEVASGGEALRQAIHDLSPDLVLMDAALESPSCLHLIKEIKHLEPATRIALFAGFQSRERVMEGLREGVNGYIVKDASTSELILAIISILKGRIYLSPEFASYLIGNNIESVEASEIHSVDNPLSHRELEVLRLVAAGRTSKEIGALLFISARTVEKHRASLMRKLRVPHMAALVTYAITNGLSDSGYNHRLLRNKSDGYTTNNHPGNSQDFSASQTK